MKKNNSATGVLVITRDEAVLIKNMLHESIREADTEGVIDATCELVVNLNNLIKEIDDRERRKAGEADDVSV